MGSDLEKLFNSELGIKMNETNALEKERMQIWNEKLKAINDIYEKISFIKNRGVRLDKANCTPYNRTDFVGGMFPRIILFGGGVCIEPSEKKEFDFQTSKYSDRFPSGHYTYESFIKKLAEKINY